MIIGTSPFMELPHFEIFLYNDASIKFMYINLKFVRVNIVKIVLYVYLYSHISFSTFSACCILQDTEENELYHVAFL